MTDKEFTEMLEKNLVVAEQKGFTSEMIGEWLSDATLSPHIFLIFMDDPIDTLSPKK